MKKRLLILISGIILSVFLEYQHTPMTKMIDSAEIIGRIEIIAVRKKRIKVKFLDIIKGEVANEIWVTKFRDWTCASRWSEYEAGQQEIIFLTKDNKKNWLPIGAGNEGEIPFKNDSVFVLSKNHFRQKRPYEKILFGKQIQYCYPFSYSDVKTGILNYLSNRNKLKSMNCDEYQNFKSDNNFLNGIVIYLKPTDCED